MQEQRLSRPLALPIEPAGLGGTLVAALVRHYDELIDYLRRRIGSRGGDHGAAGDVLHDVCLELLETPPRVPVHTPLAFLRRVVSRRAIDLYRREQGRLAWVDSLDDLPETADGRPGGRDPAAIVAGRRRLAALAAAIAALPPRCREVFVLHKIHEIPQGEVAARLDISPKTVEKHLRLGGLACRRALEQAGAAGSGEEA